MADFRDVDDKLMTTKGWWGSWLGVYIIDAMSREAVLKVGTAGW